MYNCVAGFSSTPTKNISFIPSVATAPDEHFGEILTGKIKIRIYDFSKGKGDAAIEVIARLDMGALPHLQNLCAASYFTEKDLKYPPEKYPESKIFGDPMPSGPYQGLCQMTKLDISWSASKKVWGISISNGYAQKVKTKTGGYAAASGSYREEKKGFFSLSSAKFSEILKNIADYFLLKKIEFGINNGKIKEWEAAEKSERDRYRSGHQNPQQTQQNQNAVPPAQETPASQETSPVKRYRLTIVSNFMRDTEGTLYCQCRQKEREFSLFFKETPTASAGLVKNKEIVLPVQVIGKRFYFVNM